MSASTAGLEQVPVTWDLSALFSGIDDERIANVWVDALERADRFAAAYRGKVETAQLSAAEFAKAIAAIEALSAATSKPVNYANLMFAADTSNPKHGAFLQSQMEKSSEVRVKVMFFELEIQAAPEDWVRAMESDPEMANYRHFLQVARTYSPYRLSEKEEVILEETANTGSRAWVRLFEEHTANHEYRYRNPRTSEVETLTEQDVLTRLRDPDRSVRLAAGETFTAGLREQSHVLCFIYNNLLQDKKVEDRLRGFPYPEHSRHLSNELERETVDRVVSLCKAHETLVERYYRVKREILGLSELTHIDRYAPLFETKEAVSWERAKDIVLDSFGSFSGEMRDRASEFFRARWIDAQPRAGKTGGAFCSYNTPDTHPVILMSFMDKLDDVQTLAHELGHGVHASLSRCQSFFNFHGTLPLAELASVFGEQLVFERLVERADLKDRLALYAEKIEGAFATVFRQAAMYRFEGRCHAQRRESGELTQEEFGELWQDELQAMFGESVKLGEDHKYWWSYVGHFFFAPFYVYAYSFGELLALSVYQMARLGGTAFETKYIELLKLAGSRSPEELMSTIDVDLNSEAFWRGGFQVIETLVDRFESLWAEYKSTT